MTLPRLADFSVLRRAARFCLPFGALAFGDIGTPELPLGRLLRLSLFQVSVGMALVLLNGTLNRVMVIELGLPASLVALLIALPLVVAPFRALIGFRSDNHRSVIGWRRIPYIWIGTLLQFGGFALMPFGLLVLSQNDPRPPRPGILGLRSRSSWSEPASIRCRPPASRWRPISRPPRPAPASSPCSTPCCSSAWW